MKKLEMQFINIIDRAIDGFWLNDMNGNLLYVNDAICNILGYSRNSDYIPTLERIGNEASNKKVKRYAKSNLERINAAKRK